MPAASPLTPEQRDLAARLWPQAKRLAVRYSRGKLQDADTVATDAVMRVVRVENLRNPGSMLKRRVWWEVLDTFRDIASRAKHEAGAARRDIARRETPDLDARDEVAWHLSNALTRERAAMLAYLRDGHLGRDSNLRSGLSNYRLRVTGSRSARHVSEKKGEAS